MFLYSKIYYMRYTCTTFPHIFDQQPLIIPLSIMGRTMIGCNLHWIPANLRQKFIQVIIEMRNKCINESLFHLWYRTIKYTPQLQFALCSVRKYYISNCTNVRIIPDEQWNMITNLTASLYRARYMQKNATLTKHIVQRGPRITPSGQRMYPQIQR